MIDVLDDGPRRAIWLITLADLMLLLVGFFVFLQARPDLDRARLAQSIRAGFDAGDAAPMAVGSNVVTGFTPGSATLPATDAIAWALDAARDPRVAIRVTGGTDRSADRDPATGSPAILAADRARAVAAALIAAGVAPDRIAIDTRTGAGRAVQLHLAFAGEPR